jgi:hypothetical protein
MVHNHSRAFLKCLICNAMSYETCVEKKYINGAQSQYRFLQTVNMLCNGLRNLFREEIDSVVNNYSRAFLKCLIHYARDYKTCVEKK